MNDDIRINQYNEFRSISQGKGSAEREASVLDDLARVDSDLSLDLQAEIIRLAELPDLEYDPIRRKKAKELGIRVGLLDALVSEQRKKIAKTATKVEQPKRPKVDFEICRELAHKPRILDHMASTLESKGLVGEERAAKLIYLIFTSRLLERPLCAVVKEVSSSGKSRIADYVQELFPPEAYHRVTSMSPYALAYGTEPLQHRILVIGEAGGLGESGIASYLARELISQGYIRHQTVTPDPETKELVTVTKRAKAPRGCW